MQKLGLGLLAFAAVVGWMLNAGAQVQVAPGGPNNPTRAAARGEGGVHGVCNPTIERRRSASGDTEIRWTIEPAMNLNSLTYLIELPAGATLIQGNLSGVGDPNVGTTTRGSLTIDLGTGSGFRECTITTTASIIVNGPTGPMPEFILDEAAVFWGVPSAPLPIVDTPLPGGATQQVAVVPSTTG